MEQIIRRLIVKYYNHIPQNLIWLGATNVDPFLSPIELFFIPASAPRLV